MIDRIDGIYWCSKHIEPQNYPQTLTLETPNIEEIAKAIWQRQCDALDSNSGAHDWRDKVIPPKFWNEFLLDAQAVLSFLYNEHRKYQRNNKAS